MTITRVKPGDKLTIASKIGKEVIDRSDWRVVRVYPYHVLATNGFERECFCLGELVQMGLEKGNNPKVVKKPYKPYTRKTDNELGC